ncbi:MAG: S41 family peptidase [Candidatus Yanofskybacteria bacterium]|nr:S41 family peptidase [Candidatus Yanofskybacteria bacterium]
MQKRFVPIVIVFAVAIGFIGGFYFKNQWMPEPVGNVPVLNQNLGQQKGVDFSLFWEVWEMLHNRYVDKDKLDTQDLIYGAIDGMVRTAGDPYTVFLKPKESEEFQQQIKGAFSGIGIEIGLRKNILTVIAPIKDTPAARAGLLAGDKILKINEKSTEGVKLDEAVSLIRGPRGTKVTLIITRDGLEKTKEVVITRDVIKIPAVEWKLLDEDIAYLEIFTFNQNVDTEFKKTAQEIANSKAKKIILDLRNNPGGLLDSAVNIAGYFLDTNKIVTFERFGDGQENQFRTQQNGQLKNYPVIVLINKGSASASEILAGALKDNRGILIVGETSFGKGSVQEILELPKKASLKVTIAKWFTPSGVSINENGIKPDIEVKRTEEDINADKDPQLDKAKELISNLR